jgi:hypothetical protein
MLKLVHGFTELSEKQSQFGEHQIQIKAKSETGDKFVPDSQTWRDLSPCTALVMTR